MGASSINLDRLSKGNSLSGLAGAYGYSTFIVAGPWIVMVIAIAGMSYAACPSNRCESIQIFRSVIIYNFLFSLLLAGPISLPITRFASDQIFAKRFDLIPGACLFALLLFGVLGAALVGPFYLLLADLSGPEKVAALQNFMLMGAAWLIVPFLGAMQDFRSVSIAFLLGACAMPAVITALPHPSPVILMNAFNLGLALLCAGLLWRLMRGYGVVFKIGRGLFGTFKKYWELAVIGLFYYLGIWIDNLIMWFASPTGVTRVAGVLQSMPDYDSVMFWAQLTTIPVLAVFFLYIERPLYRLNRDFRNAFQRHASKREIEERRATLTSFVLRSVFELFAAAIVITAAMMLGSFLAIESLGLRANQMGMLRAGLLGVAFHTTAIFCIIFLMFFDLRRSAALVTLVFFLSNAVLTTAFLPLGFAYFGYGNLLASAIAFVFAMTLLARELPWLTFHAFVSNNASLKAPELADAPPAKEEVEAAAPAAG